MSLEQQLKKRMKDRIDLCKSLSADIQNVCDKIKKLCEIDNDTYRMLTNPDCLLNDSPISPFQTYRYVKEQFTKEGIIMIGGYAYNGTDALRTIAQRAEEVPNWVMRFSKEKTPEKKGIEAII